MSRIYRIYGTGQGKDEKLLDGEEVVDECPFPDCIVRHTELTTYGTERLCLDQVPEFIAGRAW